MIKFEELSQDHQVNFATAVHAGDPRTIWKMAMSILQHRGGSNILDAHDGRIARLEALKENFESLQGYCERLATEFDAAAVRTSRQIADLETQVQRAVEQLRTATLAKEGTVLPSPGPNIVGTSAMSGTGPRP